MGYTHYWKAVKPLVISDKQRKLIDKVIKDEKEVLDIDENSDKLLDFNGINENSHETFIIEFGKKVEFEFCKTANKPYDLAVCKILLILTLSNGFSFSSDGNWYDWEDAITWFSEKGYENQLNNKILGKMIENKEGEIERA